MADNKFDWRERPMVSPAGGFLIQSRAGDNGNFEVVLAWPDGGLAHFWRDNDADGFPWAGPTLFGGGQYVGATVIESDFRFLDDKRLGNFELLATREDGRVDYYWRDNADFVWNGPFPISDGACGGPSMYYSGAFFRDDGDGISHQEHLGNQFVFATPKKAGGFEFGARDNPVAPAEIDWFTIDTKAGPRLRGVGLARLVNASTARATGYKDNPFGGVVPSVVAAVTDDGRLHLYIWSYFNTAHTSTDWEGEVVFGRDLVPEFDGEFTGRPCLLQGDYGYEEYSGFFHPRGHYGRLELMVPSTKGGILHFWKDCGDTDDGGLTFDASWNGTTRIGTAVYDEISFIESNFSTGEHGNFELVARTANQRGFDFYWRDEDFQWHGPTQVGEVALSPNRSHPGGGLSATSPEPRRLDVFWVRPDGAVLTQSASDAGTGWSSHLPLAISAPAVAAGDSPVAAVSRRADQLDVFWIGPDGAIMTQWSTSAPGGAWNEHAPFPVTAPGVAQPGCGLSVVSRGADQLDLFWIGPDGAVITQWTNDRPGGQWHEHDPFPVTAPGAAQFRSALSALSRGPDQLDVFWIGPDGAVITHWVSNDPGGAWNEHGPFPITPPGTSAAPGSGLAAVSRAFRRMDVFWIGPDDAIMTHSSDDQLGVHWGDHAPFAISRPERVQPRSPVVALSRRPDQLDVFWATPEASIATRSSTDGEWSGDDGSPISGPGSVRRGTGLSAVARRPDQLDVFWTAPDGTLTTHSSNGGPSGAWMQHPPVSVSIRELEVAQRLEIAWPTGVSDITPADPVSAAGVGVSPRWLDPENVVGPPASIEQILMFPARETLHDFRLTAMPALAQLLNRETVAFGDVPTHADLVRADVIAFERNGPLALLAAATAGPSLEVGWESCGWVFTDGTTTVAVDWNGRADAPRDPHAVANGSIPGSVYAGHFAIEATEPAAQIGFDECISFLVFTLPELDTDAPGFAVTVRYIDSSQIGSNTPDIHAIGKLSRKETS